MEDTVRFEHFEVLRREDGSLFELGRGAMGITYKAFDTNLRSFVALKVINAAYLNSDIARQRFLREARAAAALRHPNVATVFHLGVADDNYFYAMEFIDGDTVESFMKREGAVPPIMALNIAIQVSRALGAAEKQGLVHRDIKPSNLMLVREDEQEFTVKVIDFGLAKSASKDDSEDAVTLTSGGFLGTPHFASPEQLEEREIDVRSDIYSLGVTLWFMLAGKTPFSGSLAQVMSQHLHREPPFQTLEGQTAEVIALLKRMMAKDPADRPQTPALLRKELEQALASVPAGGGSMAPIQSVDDEAGETGIFHVPFSAPPELSVGQVLAGRYRLQTEVTASDHGRLFRAENLETKAIVGILILTSGRLATSQAYTQFENEVGALQKLQSPALQQIYSLERTEERSYLSLEWVEGPTLLDLLRLRRSLSVGEAVRILQPLGAAYDELARNQCPCPDIVAYEIILPGADVTQPVAAWSSCLPRFLPLSQISTSSLSADATMVASPFAMMKATGAFATNPGSAYVVALATLAFEMLGGVRGGSTASGGYAPIPGLNEAGNTVLKKALAPAQTYATVTEFVSALAAVDDGTPARPAVSAPSPPPLVSPAPVSASGGGRGPMVIGGAVVGLAALGLIAWWTLSRPSSIPETPPPVVTASATPVATPVPEPTPTPTPENFAYLESVKAAEALLAKYDFSAALAAFADIAEQYPNEPGSKEKLEMAAAGLRRSSPKITGAAFDRVRGTLEKASTLGSPSAQVLLAENLRVADPITAFKWFTTAADQGQTEAMVYAGQMIASGYALEKPDLKGSIVWFQKAADQGDPLGIFCLGECYLLGKGVDKDPRKALELLSDSATRQEPLAMNLLGDLYLKGIPDVMEPNLAEALRYFSSAADRGNLDAQANLAVLYINGLGVERDDKKARELFRDGAERNHPLSMLYYAQCVIDGIGGDEPNFAEARTWYIKAARRGVPKAIEWCQKNKVSYTNSP